MTLEKLYQLLNLPEWVLNELRKYQAERKEEIPENIRKMLFCRDTWGDGVKELQNHLGEDPYSMKILWEQLNFVCSYSYNEYMKRGISEEVFADTFGFVTRFVSSTKDTEGKYRYNLAWWFQRQVTLQEFRIGALEYEFVQTGDNREIEIHIPSDADMRLVSLYQSVAEFIKFQETYMPDWCGAEITTETWMIMPELSDFLPEDSKILKFKSLFDIDSVDYDQTWYMEWIFPGHTVIDDNLPEKTMLHRNLKKYLMEGNKFGIAKGHLVMERVNKVLKNATD